MAGGGRWYFSRVTREGWDVSDGQLRKMPAYEDAYELPLVNLVRERVKEWREAGYPGASRTMLDLLTCWKRDGRERRLFFTL